MENAEVAALAEFLDPAMFGFLFFRDCTDLQNLIGKETLGLLPLAVTEQELKRLQEGKKTTVNSTKTWLHHFSKWATERGVETDMELLPKTELYNVIIQLMKKERRRLQMKVMVAALDRYTRESCGLYTERQRICTVLKGKAIDIHTAERG